MLGAMLRPLGGGRGFDGRQDQHRVVITRGAIIAARRNKMIREAEELGAKRDMMCKSPGGRGLDKSDTTPPLRYRIEALFIIALCLALFAFTAYLCHVWRTSPRVQLRHHDLGVMLAEMDDAEDMEIVRGWGE